MLQQHPKTQGADSAFKAGIMELRNFVNSNNCYCEVFRFCKTTLTKFRVRVFFRQYVQRGKKGLASYDDSLSPLVWFVLALSRILERKGMIF